MLAIFLTAGLETAAMVLLSPGPRRDGLMVLLKLFPVLLMATATTLFAWSTIRNPMQLGPGFNNLGYRLTVISVATSFWIGLVVYAWSLRPRFCPACERRALVRPRSGIGDTRSQSNLFEYAWCMACEARWRRRRPVAKRWEDASDRENDLYFSLPDAGPRHVLTDIWKAWWTA